MVRLIKTSHVAETTAAFEEGESRCWQFIDEKWVCGDGKTLRGHAGGAILPRQLGAVGMHRLHLGPPSWLGNMAVPCVESMGKVQSPMERDQKSRFERARDTGQEE